MSLEITMTRCTSNFVTSAVLCRMHLRWEQQCHHYVKNPDIFKSIKKKKGKPIPVTGCEGP
jgi:hypothetical protein